MDSKLITPVLVSALLVWAIYRRFKRNIGRQPVNRRRLQFRIGIFLVIGALLLPVVANDVALLGALLGGFAGGAALASVGLKHTAFESSGDQRFYTPHTYIGLFVSALFLLRIVFRISTAQVTAGATALSNSYPFSAYQKNPLTVAILGVLIGYYALFYAGVIRKSRNPEIPNAGTADP